MFNNYFGDTIVASSISGSPVFEVESFDTGEFRIFPAEQKVPAAFSFSFEKHSVTVLVFNGTTTAVVQGDNQIPNQFRLMQNYPNPFNPATTIRYKIPRSTHVKLSIHDTSGREIARLVDESQAEGWHIVR